MDRSEIMIGFVAFTTAIVFLALTLPIVALDNGLGQVPPLAYSTWNYFNDDVNETLIMQLADGLKRTGLYDLGYATINIDAGYLTHNRDTHGNLVRGSVVY